MFDFEKTPRIDHMNDAAIDKRIKSVVAHYNSKKGREELHVLLVACAHHAVQHRDCSKITTLYDLLPANANKNGIKEWLHAYTSFKHLKDKKGVMKFLGRDKENAVSYTFDLSGEATPFYEMPKVKAAQNKEWSLIASLEHLLDTGASKLKNGKMADPVEQVLFKMLNDSLPGALETAKAQVKAASEQTSAGKPAATNVVELAA